jgi:hypothetical protein
MTVNSAGCGRAAVEQRHGDVVPSQRLSWLMASPMSFGAHLPLDGRAALPW